MTQASTIADTALASKFAICCPIARATHIMAETPAPLWMPPMCRSVSVSLQHSENEPSACWHEHGCQHSMLLALEIAYLCLIHSGARKSRQALTEGRNTTAHKNTSFLNRTETSTFPTAQATGFWWPADAEPVSESAVRSCEDSATRGGRA